MTPLILLAVSVAAGGAIYALGRVANGIVRPIPKLPARSVPDVALEHETFQVPSGEHRLATWMLRSRSPHSGEPLFVLAHGWGASHGTVLQLAEPLARAGHEVLLFDMRGHGGNQPTAYVTVRHLRDDVSAVVSYAAERFPGRPIVLVGHSFGGAASVLAVAEGSPVAALVLIATPSDVVRITAEYLSDKGMPGTLATTLLRPFWWWRLGGTFRPHSPVRRIRELDVPLLLLQPEHDERVRRRHADLLSEAAGVPYHLVKGHEHTDVLGAPETTRLVLEFVAGLAPAGARASSRQHG